MSYSVCCRSPIVPVRPTYSAELLTASFNGSLPRSSGGTGSAPDLSQSGSPAHATNGNTRGHSPMGSNDLMLVRELDDAANVWTNPNAYNNNTSTSDTYTTNTPVLQHRQQHAGGSGGGGPSRGHSRRSGRHVEGTSSAKARLIILIVAVTSISTSV